MADHAFLSEYKTCYGITASTLDTRINAWLAAVERRIRERTGGHTLVNTSSVTEYHDGDGVTAYFHARQRPIQSITSVHESSDTPRVYDATTLVDSDEYSYQSATGKVFKYGGVASSDSAWVQGDKTVQLVYTPGYANAAAVPDDLVDALLIWTRFTQLRTENAREGVSSVSAADGNVSYRIAAIPEEVEDILASWTRYALGDA